MTINLKVCILAYPSFTQARSNGLLFKYVDDKDGGIGYFHREYVNKIYEPHNNNTIFYSMVFKDFSNCTYYV